MPDLSALEARIKALEGRQSEHGNQLREHKTWQDNLRGNGDIRQENGILSVSILPQQLGVTSVAGNTTGGGDGGGGGGGGGTTVTLDVIINGAVFTYNFFVQ